MDAIAPTPIVTVNPNELQMIHPQAILNPSAMSINWYLLDKSGTTETAITREN